MRISKAAEIECRLCGHCCGPYFALYVEPEDEARWEAEGRTDLLDRLLYERERTAWRGEEPYNVETGETLTRCVYLTDAPDGTLICSIHDAKPKICRNYPPASSELCALFKK